MGNDLIKVGMLVSYDWMMLKNSIPRIYSAADSIVLAIDKERLTWSGNRIDIPDEFFEWVKTIDIEKKIDFYEDSFYAPGLNVMQNDTRERNLLAEYMGSGGWHVQVDSDEYFLDFRAFVEKLKKSEVNDHICIYCKWVPLIKRIERGYIAVDFENGKDELFPAATNYPVYKCARQNEVPIIFFDDIVLHETWARSGSELKTKLNNWGHKDDFNVESYYNFWNVLDEYNYKYVKNFHPIDPQMWPSLRLLKGEDIDSCIENIKYDLQEKSLPQYPVSTVKIKGENKSIIDIIKNLIIKY
jgi:hypothetical protein